MNWIGGPHEPDREPMEWIVAHERDTQPLAGCCGIPQGVEREDVGSSSARGARLERRRRTTDTFGFPPLGGRCVDEPDQIAEYFPGYVAHEVIPFLAIPLQLIFLSSATIAFDNQA